MVAFFFPSSVGRSKSLTSPTSVTNDGTSPFSYASVNFGEARTDRRIFIGIHWVEDAIHQGVSSATIGGVSATIHIQEGHSGGVTGFGCALISAIVPTGTSGTVAITMTGSIGAGGVSISTFISYGLISSSPTDTSSATSVGSSTNISDTIDVPNQGILIAIFSSSTNAAGDSVVWTGVTEIYDIVDFTGASGSTRVSAGVSTNLPAQTGRTLSVVPSTNPRINAGNAFVAVSWA